MVHIKGYYGFLWGSHEVRVHRIGRGVTMVAYGHLREVSSKDTCDVVGSEGFVFPVEIFAVLSF